MEAVSHLKNNTYYYGDGYFFDIVHDAESRTYDAWLYSGKGTRRIYLDTFKDGVSQKRLVSQVRDKVASFLRARERSAG
ncbi:MAG: hypothetical protein LKH04_09045 [Lachnospiraceae bacterium]|jgi:hypothetical protein|nr:hypothetical protein [Lachnospiraceae bacterium]MCI1424424.1 hypothetical protein [Lachnospiraceae bacterium]MCI1453183.1 hypothetical protein [Lachnospiraceae bacterium]MDD5850375.1 hypothetical protein [Bacillota bacterium]